MRVGSLVGFVLAACAAFGPGVASAQVLVVETAPAGAAVEVDGRAVGPSPVTVPVAAGDRRVRATLAGRAPAEATVTVGADTARVVLRLGPALGVVRVVGLPAGAETETPGWAVTGERSEVPAGLTTIRVRMPEGPPLFARVPVEADAETLVEVVEAFSTQGFAGNLVLPGSSQLARGRTGPGLGFALGTAGALGTALAAHLQVAAADADLTAAADVYREAGSEAEVAAAYVLIDAAYDRGRAGRRLRTGALAAAGAVYLGSLLDAAVRYGRQPALRVGPPVRTSAWSVHPTEAGLAARLTF